MGDKVNLEADLIARYVERLLQRRPQLAKPPALTVEFLKDKGLYMSLDPVQRAISDIRAGRMVVVVDDEDRENEGDLCLAAEKATPEAINFMARHARGLICLSLTEDRLKQLDIPMMVTKNSRMETALTVSIEAHEGAHWYQRCRSRPYDSHRRRRPCSS
ncbi:MAG: 3,4-dihydroxy-2-butanone-4-phosphate synthase [Myxococcota bacterium]